MRDLNLVWVKKETDPNKLMHSLTHEVLEEIKKPICRKKYDSLSPKILKNHHSARNVKVKGQKRHPIVFLNIQKTVGSLSSKNGTMTPGCHNAFMVHRRILVQDNPPCK